MGISKMSPLAKLVYDSLVFANLAADNLDSQRLDISEPNGFFVEYSLATNDEDYETLAQRVAERVGELEEYEWMYKDLQQ